MIGPHETPRDRPVCTLLSTRSMRLSAYLVVLAPSVVLAACGSANSASLSSTDASTEDAGGSSGERDGGGAPSGDGSSTPVSTPDASLSDAGHTSDAASSRDAGNASDATPDASATTLALAIPMYMDPSAPDWAQETSAANQVPLLVANPNSGPGASADSSYSKAVATAQAAGQTIIGYIHTSYGARTIAEVEADIDSWYSFYPAIDGIFSDETATDASLVSSYYAPLYAYVKAKGGKAVVVINPGTPPDESYMTASDVVLSFEDTYANYTGMQTPAWVASYPRTRFWHIVLSASQTEMTTAVSLARQRNAGLIYATDQGPATAYSQLVTGAYWQAELAAVAAP